MNALLRALAWFLYPEGAVCAVCGEETRLDADGLCAACRGAVQPAGVSACAPMLDGVSCGLCYAEPLKRPMHLFKYYRRMDYAAFFTKYMEIPAAWDADCLCPVPLHPFKEWQRGFNQDALLCEALRARDVCPPVCASLLRRIRYTKPQANLPAAERTTNTSGAFAASPAARGLRVILVDDVYTTGSTLSACAAALKQAGAHSVYGLCACRAAHIDPEDVDV